MQDVKMTDHRNRNGWKYKIWQWTTWNCRTWKCTTWKWWTRKQMAWEDENRLCRTDDI